MCTACGAGEALGLQLPVTLLYDCQSVTEIAAFVGSRLTGRDASESAEGCIGSAESDGERTAAAFMQEPNRPSKLLKTLRCDKTCTLHQALETLALTVPSEALDGQLLASCQPW